MWIWNSCITSEKLAYQLTSFIEKGFSGVCIRPGRDMAPAFMSKEFLNLFQTVLIISQRANFGVRLAEDFSLPWTGIFETITNHDPRMRGQCLQLEYSEILANKKNFEKPISDPETAIIVMSKMTNGKVVLSQTKRLAASPEKGILTIKPAAGEWQLMIFRKKYVSDPVSGFVPNVFIPAAAQWYIDNVCEVFKANFSKYFHTTFKGFVYELPAYIVPGDNCIPWEDAVATKYQSKYKKRLVDQLPALFSNVETEQAKNRPVIYSFINQTMHEQFTAVLEKWCARNRVTQWVLCPEQSLQKSGMGVKYCGTVPGHGNYGAVGIQNQEGSEENYPLLRAVSDGNALLFRRETITMIGRNRHGSAATLQQLKTEVDRSILAGPSTICLDGCFFNIDRRSYLKTPHNPSWYSPNWDFMKSFCDYAARAAVITRHYRFVRPAVVLNTSNSILAEYTLGASEQAQKAISLMQGTIHELEHLAIGYDLLPEEVLVSCSVFTNGDFAPSSKTRKGNYQAVIVPYARLIPANVLAFLEKIAQKSGTIIFVEEPPQGTLEDGTSAAFAYRMKKLLHSKKGTVRVVALKDFESLSAALPSNPIVSLFGKRCPDIFSAHAELDGTDLFCLHNTSESSDYFASLELPEQKNLYVADCSKGELFEIQEVQKKDLKSRATLTFLPQQTYFILSCPQKLQTTVFPKGKKPLINMIAALQRSYCIVLKDQWQFAPASLNMLPLANWNTRIGLSREFGGYSLFYEAYFEVKDVPDNCALAIGGLSGGANRHRCSPSEKPLEVAINGTRAAEIFPSEDISVIPGQTTGEQPPMPASRLTPLVKNLFGAATFVYDIKNHIRKGINRISLRTLGLLFDPQTIVYPPLIAGSFSIVKGSTGWILSNSSPSAGHDSWTKYGYPYLSGASVYKQVFELPGEYKRLVLRFSRVSDSIDVAVNGKPLGILNWHPLEIDITDVCESRRNELSVRVVNTIDNVLRMNSRPSGLMGEVYVDVY